MSFIFHCPWCSQKIECAENDNNTYARCPACEKTILVKKEDNGIHQKNSGTDSDAVDGTKNSVPKSEKDQFFTFNCPNCKAEIKTLTSDKGHVVECPVCNRSVVAYIREKEEVSANGEKEYQYKKPEYKLPVLTEVFVFNAIFHILSAFVALLCIIYHFDRGNTHLAWGSVVWLVTAISAAVFCFGIAEFFRFIGRISDNSDAIREFVEKTYYKK